MADILANSGLTPQSARTLESEARLLFEKDAGESSFIAWSVFRTLSNLWDDPQAVPAALVEPLRSQISPLLGDWLSSDRAFIGRHEIRQILECLRDGIQ